MKQVILCLTVIMALSACGHDDDSKPVVLTETPTPTVTIMLVTTDAPTPTITFTATTSPTATASSTPTITPTLATRVLQITAVMPGASGAVQLSGASDVLPLDEWVRMESDHPNLEYVAGQWADMWSWSAGQNEYHYSTNADATVRLAFEGEGVRVCYVAFWNGGIWEVVIDGQVIGTVDSYRTEAAFTCTDTYLVQPSAHILLVRNSGQHNPASSDTMLAVDAILVYRTASSQAVMSSIESLTASPAPRPAERIVLVQGPPTIQPTATDAPPAVVVASVLIAYDENANRSVDPAEGVRGIPVRLVDADTNRVLAQAFTDESGYASLQTMTNARVRLVVPYFGQYWDLSRKYGNSSTNFTLLLPPGNQPGLIP